jgi:hypothetical protein
MLRFGLTPSCGNIIGNESAWQKRKQMLAGKAAAKAKRSSEKAERTHAAKDAAAVKPVLDTEAAREAEVDENPVSVDDNQLLYRLPKPCLAGHGAALPGNGCFGQTADERPELRKGRRDITEIRTVRGT